MMRAAAEPNYIIRNFSTNVDYSDILKRPSTCIPHATSLSYKSAHMRVKTQSTPYYSCCALVLLYYDVGTSSGAFCSFTDFHSIPRAPTIDKVAMASET